ncbi:hypothetical protein F53441_12387 [Fusarium austroafricanum]|uniref:Major facilitator superfamily (MFS) profile domain-containing protein n=1 Tax=Fusarium austroafricanum TaxID=2364996 RepID=A0A8H4JVZ8_9HYPO|nr:hypothetical protein F53441_12387 [Fusarium austroafricanum]
MTEHELRETVRSFHQQTSQTLTGLRPYPTEQEVQDAAAVWHERDNIEHTIRNGNPNPGIPLNNAEREAFLREIDHSFSEKGMWMVISTVSLSAFLQGFVQSSNNGANLFAEYWISQTGDNPVNSRFAFTNAAVYFSAAVIGCPLAAPMNSLFGRRGTIIVASVLILAASVGSACIELNENSWAVLGGIRLISGVGMGLKATSTPILAAETAVGSWRGSSVLLWQLCPEKAYASLLRLRNTKMQAVRDLFLTYKGIEAENTKESLAPVPGGGAHYLLRYWKILKIRRLRNALIASGIVALSQQLSGINLMAFYGGTTLVGITPGNVPEANQISRAMLYNLIFGLLNFLFCLPAIYYIDVWGRRKILLFTVPFMAICLMGAAVSFERLSREAVAAWLYFHTIFYSPGMGPVPFILAAESFPLAYRDTGASFAISINFLFAGLLAWLQPLLVDGIEFGGTIGVFSGLNVVAFVLIFLLVEETSGVPLESLSLIFNKPKGEFTRFQIFETLPWLGKLMLGKSSLAEQPVINYDLRGQPSVHESEDEEHLRESNDVSYGMRLADMHGGNVGGQVERN